ncbi:hypothetical protein BLD44_028360 [Mastigocladus laminosus UU774]|nr:hypothetical protein BLD44_028360 [Mastigocladus laminosus UU774]
MSLLDDINPFKLANKVRYGNKSGRRPSNSQESIPPIGQGDINDAMGWYFGTYDTSPYVSKEAHDEFLRKQGKK